MGLVWDWVTTGTLVTKTLETTFCHILCCKRCLKQKSKPSKALLHCGL